MKHSNTFKIAAASILGLTALFWLFKGITDLLSGVRGGTNNLILAIVLFLLALFSWKQPLLGGIITASLGVILIVIFNIVLPDIYTMFITFFLIFIPVALAGLLFIEAAWTSKKRD